MYLTHYIFFKFFKGATATEDVVVEAETIELNSFFTSSININSRFTTTLDVNSKFNGSINIDSIFPKDVETDSKL